jgi:hypothetical protein
VLLRFNFPRATRGFTGFRVSMSVLRNFFLAVTVSIVCCPLGACSTMYPEELAPPEAWDRLAGGEHQDLIVAFDDAAIQARALQLKKERQEMFDDDNVLRFKAAQYASLKKDALSAVPDGQVEVLKDYPSLPLMFLRFHSADALRTLLARPSVKRAYENTPRDMVHGESQL